MIQSALIPALLLCATTTLAQTAASAPAGCGQLVSIETHDRTTTKYSLAGPAAASTSGAPITLLLLIGGSGMIALDDQACQHALSRNSLVRMRPALHAVGIATALVDVPSDISGTDGLAGLRVTSEHADDLGKIISDLRQRTKGTVWVVGHSRGSLSAANAAVRLSGLAAPDGVVLMSAMMSGEPRGKKAWTSQSVFDLPLEALKIPLLMIGHVADNCPRSLASAMPRVIAKTQSSRPQEALINGGPVPPGRAINLSACEVGEPHDFVEQDAILAAGITRFVRGEKF